MPFGDSSDSTGIVVSLEKTTSTTGVSLEQPDSPLGYSTVIIKPWI